MSDLQKKMLVGFLCVFAATRVFAIPESSATFFASNNTKEITVQSAYARLTGQPQIELKNILSQVLKKNHVKEGSSGRLLGAYQMSTDKDMTADNTEYVTTDSSQILSDQKIFFVAKTLAIKLHQDSVAVFLPDSKTVGDISVSFIGEQPSIQEIIAELHDKLPASYSQGFSLHLINTPQGFDHAKVTEVEWLGSKINIDDIKKAFPNEKINAHDGTAYLVYENGKEEKL